MREERELCCRRWLAAGGGDALPFALPGSRATYAPDRVCDVEHLRIEVTLDFAAKKVRGRCTQALVVLNDGPARLRLDAVEMTLRSVELAGAAVPFGYDGKLLTVELGERRQGERLELSVDYEATPRRGLYFIAPDAGYPDRKPQAWTQGQDEDNRCWFPCFDHPHEKSTSEVIAHVPASMTALSNGRLVEDRVEGAGRRVWYRMDEPHSSYLITLVAGEYATLHDRAGEIELYYFVPPGREDDAPRTFANTPKMIELFSDWTGRKYPWGRYSQITVQEFIFGGMENTSATTLTDQTLHDARAHLDFSSEPLIAHELAHQWFGDLLTCRDWSQGWLNEGFATYFEILWKEASAGIDDADYDRLGDMEAYLDEDSHRYRRPIVTNVYHEPIDVFDRHLYEKGGCVLHMLRRTLGDARFKKALAGYIARHEHSSVETRDLARAVEAATGWNPDRFFEEWVFRGGHPELSAELSWDEGQKLVRVALTQKQETPFQLPLTIRTVVGSEARDHEVVLDEKQQVFLLPLGGKPVQVIVDPGNHLLKTYEEKKPDDWTRAELSGAERAIDRVRAARSLARSGEPTHVPALAEALAKDSHWTVRGEAALALGAIKTGEARDQIAGALANEQHPKARRLLVRALGSFRNDEQAADAALRVLGGDASYFVEGEAALTLAKTRSPRAFDQLREVMKRPSYLDTIRSSALSGLAELRDERGIDVALAAARYGEPVIARRAAIGALGSLGGEHAPRKRQVRETLEELLDDPDFRARIAAVEALRTLGDSASLGALGRAEQKDLDGRVRRRAREVARTIHEHAEQPEALKTLRDSVEKLEEQNRQLQERLRKIETRLEIK